MFDWRWRSRAAALLYPEFRSAPRSVGRSSGRFDRLARSGSGLKRIRRFDRTTSEWFPYGPIFLTFSRKENLISPPVCSRPRNHECEFAAKRLWDSDENNDRRTLPGARTSPTRARCAGGSSTTAMRCASRSSSSDARMGWRRCRTCARARPPLARRVPAACRALFDDRKRMRWRRALPNASPPSLPSLLPPPSLRLQGAGYTPGCELNHNRNHPVNVHGCGIGWYAC